MRKPFVFLIAFLGLSVTAPIAGSQTVLAPVPASAVPPAYRCEMHLLDENRRIVATRELDTLGQFLSESIRWNDARWNKSATPRLEIKWHPEYGHQRFEKGVVMLSFNIRPREIKPLRLSLSTPGDNGKMATFDAGMGMPAPRTNTSDRAEVYAETGPLLDISPDAARLSWRLERLSGYRGKPVEVYEEGDLDLTFLKAAKAEFPILMQKLDALQAQYLRDCDRL